MASRGRACRGCRLLPTTVLQLFCHLDHLCITHLFTEVALECSHSVYPKQLYMQIFTQGVIDLVQSFWFLKNHKLWTIPETRLDTHSVITR